MLVNIFVIPHSFMLELAFMHDKEARKREGKRSSGNFKRLMVEHIKIWPYMGWFPL